jgi:predicted ATPase/DNA-binding CsgD family transcriptional regulator
MTEAGSAPARLTSFVGRERELAHLADLFGTARLITLTGPGGSGKTRLALEFAARESSLSPVVVDLTPVTDAGAILGAISSALGIHEEAGEELGDRLATSIGGRETLLVLDNLEQIPDAGLVIAALVASTGGLRVLATGRAALHVQAEHEFPVAPLEEASAVALFLDRARAIDPRFTLDDEETAAVAGICARLDGLPLAIELAAARTRLFTPTALLDRLEQQLPTLADGPADAPDRQRTLHAAIAWSFDLLSEDEQRAFAALGVFAGGFTLAAAEAIAIESEGSPGVLASLEHLVDQNVLTVSPDADGEPRFRLLETIRAFAWEEVPDADHASLRDRHLAYFVERAERAEPLMRGAEQATWVRRLAAEQADIRAALTWAENTHQDESLLRLASALKRRFWYEAGGLAEGLRWLEAGLEAAEDAPAALRAKALQRAAWITWEMDDGDRAEELFEASLAVSDPDDHLSRFEALIGLSYRSIGTEGADLQVAADRMNEAIEHAREDGTPGALVEPLMAQGHLERARGDLQGAMAYFEEALEMARASGDVWAAASALSFCGSLALTLDDPARARPLLEESTRMSVESGDREVFVHATAMLAEALTGLGAADEGRAQLMSGRDTALETTNPLGVVLLLDAAAAWLAAVSEIPAAVEAWAATERFRIDHHWPEPAEEERARRAAWARAREAIGTVRFDMLWADGDSRDLADAFDRAMAAVEDVDLSQVTIAPSVSARRGRFDLTPREQEVLAMVAEGLSDGEIAERLVISKKTASVHVANIKSKLGASSRVEVATIAVRESLT